MASSFEVSEVGSYYVGGRTATLNGLPEKGASFTSGVMSGNPNGDIAVEAMYVQYIRLVRPRGRVPLMLWHGGGLTGTTYETKPDGTAGWQQYFLERGWDVYISDAVERGRAGWVPSPEVWPSGPIHRTNNHAWVQFRIGPPDSFDSDPAKRTTIPGVQFPAEAFDEFGKYTVPRWLTNDAAIQSAYDAYVDRQGPCVILGHSQGAAFAYRSALHAPANVKAIVNVEGRPPEGLTDAEIAALKHIPQLLICGDNVEGMDYAEGMRELGQAFARRIVAAGGTADYYNLPEMGIRGNSHMIMMDRNSDEVAGLIQSWLEKQGLVR